MCNIAIQVKGLLFMNIYIYVVLPFCKVEEVVVKCTFISQISCNFILMVHRLNICIAAPILI